MEIDNKEIVMAGTIEKSLTPGINRTYILIKIKQGSLKVGDVIRPIRNNCQLYVREANEKYQNLYACQLMTDDPLKFLPVEYLEEGTKWIKP